MAMLTARPTSRQPDSKDIPSHPTQAMLSGFEGRTSMLREPALVDYASKDLLS